MAGPVGAAGAAEAEAAAEGAGERPPLKVALMLAPGMGEFWIAGGGGAGGMAEFWIAGGGGAGGMAEFWIAGGGGAGGGGAGGAAGLFWANALSAIRLTQRVVNVFIVAAIFSYQPPWLGPIFIPNGLVMSRAKTFTLGCDTSLVEGRLFR
jgi:hypothetical protein